jgi:hypothetical protein
VFVSGPAATIYRHCDVVPTRQPAWLLLTCALTKFGKLVQIGERIFFEEGQPEPAAENRVQKKKLWEAVQAGLITTGELMATFKGTPMMTSAGPVTTATLKEATIS